MSLSITPYGTGLLRKGGETILLSRKAISGLTSIAFHEDADFELDFNLHLAFSHVNGDQQYIFQRTFEMEDTPVKLIEISLGKEEWDPMMDQLRRRGFPADNGVQGKKRPALRESDEPQPHKRRLSYSGALPPNCYARKHLGRDRYFTVNTFNNVDYVHLRIHEEKNSGLIPTKMGICLTLPQYLELTKSAPFLETAESGERRHIGGGKFVSVDRYGKNHNVYHIRAYYKPEDAKEPLPTRTGITLNNDEYKRLLGLYLELPETLPFLKNIEPCWARDDHNNQLGALQCSNCHPWHIEF